MTSLRRISFQPFGFEFLANSGELFGCALCGDGCAFAYCFFNGGNFKRTMLFTEIARAVFPIYFGDVHDDFCVRAALTKALERFFGTALPICFTTCVVLPVNL